MIPELEDMKGLIESWERDHGRKCPTFPLALANDPDLQKRIMRGDALDDLINKEAKRSAKEAERRAVERAFKLAGPEFYADTPTPFLIESIESVNAEFMAYVKSHPHSMCDVHPRRFEELIAELLASFGWQVELTSQTRDGGYDIFAIQPATAGVETPWIVECKRFRPDRPVGIDIVRALYGVKTDLRVGMAMVATTSRFSESVHSFKTSRYDLALRDYEGIVEWLNDYRPSPSGVLYSKASQLILPGRMEK